MIFSIAKLIIMIYPNFSKKLNRGFKILKRLYPGKNRIQITPRIRYRGCIKIELKVITK